MHTYSRRQTEPAESKSFQSPVHADVALVSGLVHEDYGDVARPPYEVTSTWAT
jgi:hypothetical protein